MISESAMILQWHGVRQPPPSPPLPLTRFDQSVVGFGFATPTVKDNGRESSWVVTDDKAVVELWPLCQRSCTFLSNISFCHQLWLLEKRLLCQN